MKKKTIGVAKKKDGTVIGQPNAPIETEKVPRSLRLLLSVVTPQRRDGGRGV
eukprot:SAG31_NODE_10373_length_1146_cov_1.822350_1_plen_52_part_00